ncbi:hypothetical protein [Devosia sp. CN2-171]|uniref:hypothetical protein n=1 Tax=Devosia sp. CN2-171 TaxID=3400909 RepID=UPI003BF7D669
MPKVLLAALFSLLSFCALAQEDTLSDAIKRADELLAKVDAVNVVAWGDSMTMGYGARTPYPKVAASSLHVLVANMGFGGQTSTAIASRAGALPIMLAPKDGAILEVGSVEIVGRSIAGIDGMGPLTKFGRQELEGELGGVPGALVRASDDTYSFRRSGRGDRVTCSPSCQFVPTETYRTRTQWIWAGRNGTAPGRTIFEDIAAIAALAPDGRFLVAGFTTSAEQSPKSIAALLETNEKLRTIYGSKYVDVLAVLMAAGDGSPEDAKDIAKGIVPRSLRVDLVHLTNVGYSLVADAFVAAHVANGYCADTC